ncbi:MAG: nitrous oxide reductase family maturation protein NosD [Gemmatimonadaceae bacterium]|nr:nitrous oxide reductase family maturation protein NosD [Gemmatimonadaceae bacterium]
MTRAPRGWVMRRALVVALVAGSAACVGRDPAPIAYGRDSCDYCRMQITDPRFGAELVTQTGKVLRFDSIECLAGYYASTDSARVRSLWVSDYAHPGTLIPARTALYLRVPGPGSPMGRGLLAVATARDAAALRARFGGESLGWTEMLAAAAREGRAPIETAAPVTAAGGERTVTVDPAGPVRTITAALQRVARGGRIVVRPGTYREPTIVVDRPVTITGEGRPTLDGEGARQIMTVTADDVTVQGLRFAHVGASFIEDRAAIKVSGARHCVIRDNMVDDAFFGIYLARATDCVVARNVVRGRAERESSSGNGIHLWSAHGITVEDNHVAGHRDGIYLEFTTGSDIRRNVSTGNLRYGLHFMYSDDCRYRDNIFRANGAGVAVMYAHRVEMTGNRFEQNWGSAAYGLLLKEIADSRIAHNVFDHNTVALLADGAERLVAERNDFVSNGWAVRLEGDTQDGRFTANDFVGNTFDVATASRTLSTTFDGNYWDGYGGYDLDRDGAGDVPYHPVRFFSLVVAQHEPSLVLLRSPLVAVLDAAERALPVLTPAAVSDHHPRMHRVP